MHASPGRVVWYYPPTGHADFGDEALRRPARLNAEPFAAQVAFVHDGRRSFLLEDPTTYEVVNLGALDHQGAPFSIVATPLFMPGEVPSTFLLNGGYATWMPYQVQQARRDTSPATPSVEPGASYVDADAGAQQQRRDDDLQATTPA